MNKSLLTTLMTTALFLTPLSSNAEPMGYPDPFNTFFDTMMLTPKRLNTQSFSAPRMDVADLKDKIEVKAELPGMSEKDINLTLENNILTLSSTHQQEVEEQNKDYYLKEISSGSFSRSIRLPQNIDEEKIDAEFQNGILTITIPKTEVKEETAKKIPIKKIN